MDKDFNDLNNFIDKAKKYSKENNQIQINTCLKTINTYRKTILNPQSHDNNESVFKTEIKEAIEKVKELKTEITKTK